VAAATVAARACGRHFELGDEVCPFCGNQYVVEAVTPASEAGKEEARNTEALALHAAGGASEASVGVGAAGGVAGSGGAALAAAASPIVADSKAKLRQSASAGKLHG
jgi:hypothetical protein